MKYVKTFGSIKEALKFKKQTLAEADYEKHTYMMNVNKKILVFKTNTIADHIMLEYRNDNSDESNIAKGLIEGKLLGAGFDYDNDTMISESDLLNVTNLGNVFASKIEGKSIVQSNYKIYDFSVFEKCENVEDITGNDGNEYMNLFGCIDLVKVKLPKNITEIGNSAFAFCINLIDVTLNDNVKTVCTKAFFNCLSLKTLEFPETLKTIETKAFAKCDKLVSLKFNSADPCKVYKDTFAGIPAGCKIYVPKKSVNDYKESWKYVNNEIIGF